MSETRLRPPTFQSFYNDHSLFDDSTGVVHDLEEGRRIGVALGDHKAVILRNHGLLTVGHSVDEAVWWFITMERSCQAQLMAEAVGKPTCIEPEYAAHARRHAPDFRTESHARRVFLLAHDLHSDDICREAGTKRKAVSREVHRLRSAAQEWQRAAAYAGSS